MKELLKFSSDCWSLRKALFLFCISVLVREGKVDIWDLILYLVVFVHTFVYVSCTIYCYYIS